MSYECAGGSLKLKGVLDKKIKKKKKTKNPIKELQISTVNKPDLSDNNSNLSDSAVPAAKVAKKEQVIEISKEETSATVTKKIVKTKAELEFEKAMEKRNEEKILKRAERSHKEHVEEYNRHLDSLSEYNDIPKVSWTK